LKESVNYQVISPKDLAKSVLSEAGWSNFLVLYFSTRLVSYYICSFLFSINDDSIYSVLVSSIIIVAAVFLISFFNFVFGQCKGKKFQDPLDLALLFVGGEVISFKRLDR